MAKETIVFIKQLINSGKKLGEPEEFSIQYDEKTAEFSAEQTAYRFVNKNRNSFSHEWYDIVKKSKTVENDE